MALNDIRNQRLEKLKKIKNPYQTETDRSISIEEVLADWEALSSFGKEETVAGRIMAKRGQGAILFTDIFDGTGKLQIILKKEITGEEEIKNFEELTDLGDFVEARGTFFVTQRGEKSLEVKSWKMLSKSLLPLPEKWEGLQDPDAQMRQRYLHLISDPEARSKFETRFRIISAIRKFLEKAGFVEVETPMMQPLYGGASALPFTTHYNALDTDFYLRISPELYLKRLIVGGFNKVFELNRNFRNEGIDVTHSPEFTMLEFYSAYESAKDGRKFVEKLFKYLVKEVFKTESITYDGNTIDFSKKFEKVTFFDLIEKNTQIKNPAKLNREGAAKEADKLGVYVSAEDSLSKILDNIYKKHCRGKVIQPTFVVDYPADYLPLAKRKEKKESLVDAYQLIIGGVELVKAYSELNDPIDQKIRFESQEKNKKAGEADAQSFDADFIEALEHGMPPTSGVGIGIDRLVMLLTNTHNIRDIILFPTLKKK